jgi:hypothetical protein
VHIAIDNHARLAYAEVLPEETAATAASILVRADVWYAAIGIGAERVLADKGNGCCGVSR